MLLPLDAILLACYYTAGLEANEYVQQELQGSVRVSTRAIVAGRGYVRSVLVYAGCITPFGPTWSFYNSACWAMCCAGAGPAAAAYLSRGTTTSAITVVVTEAAAAAERLNLLLQASYKVTQQMSTKPEP